MAVTTVTLRRVATNTQKKMSFDIQVALQVGTVKTNRSVFSHQCTITVTAVQLSIRFRMPHDGVRAATSFFNEPQWPQ